MKANPTFRSPEAARTASLPRRSSPYSGLLLFLPALVAVGCSGGSKGDPDNRGDFKVVSISTGLGSVYPYQIRQADQFGNPTSTVLNIESIETLKSNVTGNNGVLPPGRLPATAVLPNGSPGNQFLHFTFSHKLDVDSILSNLLANQASAGLTGALTILAYNPADETAVPVQGRGFVAGQTYINEGGVLRKVQAIRANGTTVEVVPEFATQFNGFPIYPGSSDLAGLKSFVFVADSDGDLSTIETFPTNRLLRIAVTSSVRDSENDILEQEIATATTVGPDNAPPQVLGYLTRPEISPGNNQTGIDPTSTILIRFNKPVQPGQVGSFFDPQQFTPASGGVSLSVTAAAQTFPVIYHADPVSYGDLMNYIITPAYNLPGQSIVDVSVQNTTIRSLTGLTVGTIVSTRFTTGVGPGIVNAPVAPEAVYVGIGGAEPGVSVIDLNGFGQGTGDLQNTRFPLNPNIGISGVTPQLAPGTTNLDAGGAGVFTLVRDTNLETRLLRDPVVGDVTDIHIGAPLDLVFNNENININASRANQVNQFYGSVMPGNTISQPPVPNPPRLVFPPPNPNRAIFGEEPTTKSSYGPGLITAGPPGGCITSPLNQLGRGNPFSSERGSLGLLGTSFMGVFVGPQPPPAVPPPPPPYCPFTSRQQIGHFLYVLDRDNRQILVVNSNRFTVLDAIRVSDPVSMAMSPNMTRLAVTNFSGASVTFIDIDPTSPNFNTVVAETRVERGPTAVAWQPDGEDVFVVSTDANLLSIISAQDFTVRKTLGGFMNLPIDIVLTERFVRTGNASGLYYGYVLNSNGSVAIYESGPDGVNGIGFNNMVSLVTNVTFPRARSMFYDHVASRSGVFIGHVDDSGLGQVSRLQLTTSPLGQLPIQQNFGLFQFPPTYRQKEWTVTQRFGGIQLGAPVRDRLSGDSIIDVCVDDLSNVGGLIGQGTPFNSGFLTTPYTHSGKHTVKTTATGGAAVAIIPRYLFVALSDVGAVDIVEVETGTRVASIPVPGVRVVSSYWRQ